MKNKIPISKVKFSKNEINDLLKVIKSGWIVQGPKVKLFETMWSKYIGAKFSIAVNSCTSALLISILASGIRRNDEVIVPSFTWASTANIVEQAGGKVVFCDISLKDFNIDTIQLKKKINKKTRFIIPVHLFGAPCNMDEIKKIIKGKKIKIIEDAACGHGAFFNKKHVGTFGVAGCFSFHPRKIITTGEGGLISTNNKNFYEKCRKLRDHGLSFNDLSMHKHGKPYDMADHTEAGFNMRLTDIQASLAIGQIQNFNKTLKKRQELVNYYNQILIDNKSLKIPLIEKSKIHSYQSYVILIRKFNTVDKNRALRNLIMQDLKKKNIQTRPGTHAIHLLSYYKKKYKIKKKDFNNSYIAHNNTISLPLYDGLKKKQIQKICKVILKHLG